jgi:hypothetical protein
MPCITQSLNRAVRDRVNHHCAGTAAASRQPTIEVSNYLDGSLRPLVMFPSVLMVAVVVIGFMEIGKGPAIARGFAIAAMFWLIVLLGLGSVDPLTRTDYRVPHAHVD